MTRLFSSLALGRVALVLAPLSLATLLAACTDDASHPTSPPPVAPSFTTGLVPVIAVTPSLTFGPQTVGTSSPAQDIVISNTGTGDLHLSGATEKGDDADFGGTSAGPNLCAIDAPVPPGGSCRLPVEFSPKAEGPRASTITFSSDGGEGTVYVTGTGVVLKPALTVSVQSLAFGSQLVGTSGTSQVVKFTNTGSAPLTFSDAEILGPNAADFVAGEGTNWCSTGIPVDIGATCNVAIKFAPKAVGPRSAYLSVKSDGGDAIVWLSGTGFAMPTADVSASVAANPNPAQANKPLYYTITVKNAGPDAATDVSLTNAIPSTTTFASVEAPNGVSCNAPAVGSTGAITCALGTLSSGAARTIKLTVKVLSGGKNSISNTATVTATSADPVAANNVATILTTVYGRK
jgi:uncharacterized repeat protein (TIGR01451 family)